MPPQSVKILVAEETGPDVQRELVSMLARTCPSVVVGKVGEAPAEAIVVGGWLAADDLRAGLDAGVRWVQTCTTGVDHVLTPEVVASDVVVTNSAGATAPPVAELVFARMLEHAKELRRMWAQQARHEWAQGWLASLAGATLVVVGLGPVGTRVAALGKAFGMRVVGVRRRVGAGSGPCDEVVGTDHLAAAAAKADFLVVAAALTDATRQLIGAHVLDAMKEGSLLVNVSRGELVDHDALVDTLARRDLHAALDVFPQEPLPPESPLWDVPNIAISPHNGALTPPLIGSLVQLIAENVRRFVAGEPLQHIVDKTVGYPTA